MTSQNSHSNGKQALREYAMVVKYIEKITKIIGGSNQDRVKIVDDGWCYKYFGIYSTGFMELDYNYSISIRIAIVSDRDIEAKIESCKLMMEPCHIIGETKITRYIIIDKHDVYRYVIEKWKRFVFRNKVARMIRIRSARIIQKSWLRYCYSINGPGFRRLTNRWLSRFN